MDREQPSNDSFHPDRGNRGFAMDRDEREWAFQRARDLCLRVGARANEVGFLDGRIIARRHRGNVTHVRLDVGGPDSDSPDELPPVHPEVGIHRARRMLRATLREVLQPCIVRFGEVTILFSRGVLDEIWVMEKFMIEKEIPDLARLFVPSLVLPHNGHAPRKTRVGRSGRPR